MPPLPDPPPFMPCEGFHNVRHGSRILRYFFIGMHLIRWQLTIISNKLHAQHVHRISEHFWQYFFIKFTNLLSLDPKQILGSFRPFIRKTKHFPSTSQGLNKLSVKKVDN